MKKVNNIKLAFPCSESLDLSNGHSFCSKCKNNIHDFRESTQDGLEQLLKISKNPVCGTFHKSQLDKNFTKYAASAVIAITGLTAPVFGQKIKLQPIDSIELFINDSIESEDEIFFGLILEVPASPIGGYEEFYKAIGQEIRLPENLTTKAKVFIQIEIDTSGTISETTIVKSFNSSVDKEALRALKQINYKFEPAKQRGRRIKSKLILPIFFDPNPKE